MRTVFVVIFVLVGYSTVCTFIITFRLYSARKGTSALLGDSENHDSSLAPTWSNHTSDSVKGFSAATPTQFADGIQLSDGFKVTTTIASSFTSATKTAVNLSSPPQHHYKMIVCLLTAARPVPTIVSVAARLAEDTDRSLFKLIVWQSFSSSGDVNTRTALENLGYTVYAQSTPYPELNEGRIQITHGDPPHQVKWRTNHLLDYANALERSLQYNADYIMVLEDDMMPARNSLAKAYASLTSQVPVALGMLGYVAFFSLRSYLHSRGWANINGNLGAEGACTLTFHRSLVSKLMEHLRSQPYADPVDMSIWAYIERGLHLKVYERVPNLFQHIPKQSTLKNLDPPKEITKEERSTSFMYDEGNRTLLLHPSASNGYIGCFADDDILSDLSGAWSILTDASGAAPACRHYCLDLRYLFFGLRFTSEGKIRCSCANEFGRYGPAPVVECTSIENQSSRRGTSLMNAVYRVSAFNATYLGCYANNGANGDRELHHTGSYTPITCMDACSVYEYFGLINDGECYCSHVFGGGGRSADNECDFPCRMDLKLDCGGSSRTAIFRRNKMKDAN